MHRVPPRKTNGLSENTKRFWVRQQSTSVLPKAEPVAPRLRGSGHVVHDQVKNRNGEVENCFLVTYFYCL